MDTAIDGAQLSDATTAVRMPDGHYVRVLSR